MKKIQSANTLSNMPYIPYNIITELALTETESANNIFKILKYNTTDCLNKDNLLFEEKKSMIWTSEPEQQDFNIFLTKKTEDLLTESKTYLKVYQDLIKPINLYKSVVLYNFDMIIKGKIDMIYFNGILCNRLDVLQQLLLENLNGSDIGGQGALIFDTTLSRMCESTLSIGDNQSIIGRSLSMAVPIETIRDGVICD
jgi:hypothetical protein